MALNQKDLETIEGLIAAKTDLVTAFRNQSDQAKELIGQEIEGYLYARQRALREPENTYTPRITIGDADINVDDDGVLRGHAGPTLPRWLNFVTGVGSLDPDDFAKVNLRVGGGGVKVDGESGEVHFYGEGCKSWRAADRDGPAPPRSP